MVAAVAGLLLAGLAVLIVVDKRRPIRHLDEQPHQDERAWLGDGDLNRITDERIAAESRLHRRIQ